MISDLWLGVDLGNREQGIRKGSEAWVNFLFFLNDENSESLTN